ncbi:MAG: hypothetical protein HY011_25065 [Acidobacteria bacterium]|nr:hypothetical protein [Acidobacteriota bacterium]
MALTALLFATALFLPAQAQTTALIRTPAGSGVYGFAGDNGPATNALLATPTGIAVDADGNLYIADSYNNRIRKVSLQGTITTIAGTGVGGYSGDNGPATQALIDTPTSLVFDRQGNLFFTDSLNNVVRKIDTTGKITTIAGTGQEGFAGDGGPATQARLGFPQSLTIDAGGNLYLCDTFNNRVRKVTPQGTISTVAGSNGQGGYSGDGGPATQARLDSPDGAAVDRLGNLYIADTENFVVRKVDTTGKISTFAGTGQDGYSGDNLPATQTKLSPIRGVAVDKDGIVYISDPGNDRIRRVDLTGRITTFAGTGGTGYNGDGISATQALLNEPIGVIVDAYGVLYFADSYGDRIRSLKGTQLQIFGLSQYVIPSGGVSATLKVLGAGLENNSVTLNGQAVNSLLDAPTGNLSLTLTQATLATPTLLTVRVTASGGASFQERTAVIASAAQLNLTTTVSVLAASYQTTLAPDAIAALFGTQLATQTNTANSVPLPTTLGGTRIFANGSPAPLFFVSPTQTNYLLPASVVPGVNTQLVTVAGNGIVSQQTLKAFAEAPGVFTANASGSGGPAALWTRDGVSSFAVTNPDGSLNPITTGAFLILFGTGWRHAPDPVTNDDNGVGEIVQANFGGTIAPVAFAAAQGGLVGLDQMNVAIPTSLAGRGVVDLTITVNGMVANVVKVRIN